MKRSAFSLQEKRDFARDMRRNMTTAERTLWWKLSRNQFGYRFNAQFPLQGYIVDFYCGRLRLVIEVDGSVHDLEDQAADDEQRDRILENHGMLVLRFSNEDVLDHLTVVLTRIWDECTARRVALKAFPSKKPFSKTNTPSRVSSACASVENSVAHATVDKLSVDAEGRVPATAEDIKAVNDAFRNLVCIARARAQVLQFGNPFTLDGNTDNYWQHRRTELKTQAEAAKRLLLEAAGQTVLPVFGDGTPRKLMETEPATLVFKGMEVEEA